MSTSEATAERAEAEKPISANFARSAVTHVKPNVVPSRTIRWHCGIDDGIVVVVVVDYWRLVMAPAPELMTVDDYFAFTPFSLKPMELIYGAVRIADAPLPRHQSAVAELFRSLDGHVRSRKLGKIWLSPLDVCPERSLGADCSTGSVSAVLPGFTSSLDEILEE